MKIDTAIFEFVFNLGQKIGADWFYVFLSTYLIYIIGAILLFFILKEKDRRKKIYFILLTILLEILTRGVITEVIRFFSPRQRPFEALGITPLISNGGINNSFPSGQVVFAFSLALVVFLINKKWGYIVLIMAGFVSLGRILVGVHWPLDVIFGFIVSLIGYLILSKILKDKEEVK